MQASGGEPKSYISNYEILAHNIYRINNVFNDNKTHKTTTITTKKMLMIILDIVKICKKLLNNNNNNTINRCM